jgi:hypothetical protein
MRVFRNSTSLLFVDASGHFSLQEHPVELVHGNVAYNSLKVLDG